MNVKNFNNNIELLYTIGKGSYGNVYLGKNKVDDKCYAIKVISKSQLQSKIVYQYFNNEIYILKHINHPNIVKYISLVEKKKDYWLIIEYCNGGSLVKALKYHLTQFNKPVPENIVRYFIKNILTAVIYLNNKNIIHRDIKSDNILLHYENEQDLEANNFTKAKIKLIDFGFARYLDENELAGSLVGTPMYMDPKVLQTFLESKSRVVQGFYDQKVDVWSLGILTYELLIGIVPFMSKDIKGLFANVNKRDFYIPKEEKRNFYLSEYAIKFIDKTLNIDTNVRPLPSELIRDPWINNEESVLYQMKTDDEIKLIKNKKLFINFWKPKENKILNKSNFREKIMSKRRDISLNIDKEKKKKIFMNFHKKNIFNNIINNNNKNYEDENAVERKYKNKYDEPYEEKEEKQDDEDVVQYEEKYINKRRKKNINNCQQRESKEDSIDSDSKNVYKYTRKKPKKIIKNIDTGLNNINNTNNTNITNNNTNYTNYTNDEKSTRFNTENVKNMSRKKLLRVHKGESTKNNNNKLDKITFSNTYTNFSYADKNENNIKNNKIKIKSINYISNNDDKNQNQNNINNANNINSQNDSYKQYKVIKYISPSKNLCYNNFIHKTWTNNFLYKKKKSFNNSMRKTKQYPQISKEDNEESEDE
jgi:serine/threonine protein kinase